jgi:hypothetical protein
MRVENQGVSLLDQIVQSPRDWTGDRVIHEVGLAQYKEPDRRRDPDLPAWLRDVLVLCDFDTHVLMEGFLGWWENRASDDAPLVADAFRSVGMHTDAQLLESASHALDPAQLDSDRPSAAWSISTFAERHPAVSPEQSQLMQDIERRLYLNRADGADLYAALVAHATSGLASLGA